MISLLEVLESVAFESLTTSYHGNYTAFKRNTIPGWSDCVKPFREKAMFWSSIWKSAGKPLNNELHKLMKTTRNKYHYQVRKVKKSEDEIRKYKLLDACLNGSSDLFKEIKRMRKHAPQIASSIDGKDGNASDTFKDIYSKLYNSVDDKIECELLMTEINDQITHAQLHEVNMVTPNIIKDSAKNLSNSKSDPVYAYSSDCIKHGTDYLYEMLAVAFQSYLIHGHMTLFLLLATLIPIIKDKLGSINSSKNYRSIAISSLILKLFDWIIINLFGGLLSLDDLQFAYQARCSTTMCTWSITETIGYFKRNGSDVYTCCMDMTKAFDLVRHGVLFRKLLDAGIPPIFLRLLLFIYVHQYANVRWGNSVSEIFPLSNGVRQGGVISAILYCFYGNILFSNLRKSGYGCWINGAYTGIYGYSDDNFLLAPSLYALQKMLEICEDFASSHGLLFSTDADPSKCKTKCIAFTRKPTTLQDIRLCGNVLPWVNSFKHLGNSISNDSSVTDLDISTKRAQYISKCLELDQEFYFASGKTKFQLNSIYNFHFTGSPLWDLFGKTALSLEATYNKSVKNMFNLPLETHRSFIEPVTNKPHLRKILMSRFLSFIKQVHNSPKAVPKMLLSLVSKDVRSTTGSNLRKLLLLTGKCNVNDLVQKDIFEIRYHPLDTEDMWKADLLLELLDEQEGILSLPEFNRVEINDIIQFLCKD